MTKAETKKKCGCKKAAKQETFFWQTTKVEKSLDTALKTLSARYPQLVPSKGDIKLVFEKNPGSSECSVKKEDGTITITYGKLNMALRMTGSILSGLGTPSCSAECRLLPIRNVRCHD